MLDVITALQRSPAVRDIQVIDFIDDASIQYLKCRAELIDGSSLHVTESAISGYEKYSYHWQDMKRQLIIRWDNKPHHTHISTFPHHRHEGGKVLESPRVTISEVLTEIEARFRAQGVLP